MLLYTTDYPSDPESQNADASANADRNTELTIMSHRTGTDLDKCLTRVRNYENGV
jgi:hypothetical protein